MHHRPRELDALLDEYQPGHAMPRGFYTSQAIYDHDIIAVWNRNWIWVGHESQIPDPGDYFLFDYGTESIIIVRDRKGQVCAHMNVCRHRGSRVCTEKSGKARVLVCPYHAWTFELSGELRAGRAMGPDFDPSGWGLFPVRVTLFQGMIFVCPDADTPALEPALTQLSQSTAPFGLDNLKIAHQATYPVPANWKLAVENYLECYHCGPAHKEYSRSHSLKSPDEMAALIGPMEARASQVGLSPETLDSAPTSFTSAYCRRYPLYEGYQTGSQSGAPLAPLLGDLKGFDGGATDLGIGPLNWFLVYSDCLVGYRFVPRALQKTDIEVVWMVRADAEEGRDYDKDALTWLWHVTSQDDERIIRNNQAGVNSAFFQPGPLAEMETAIKDFYQFYFRMIQHDPETGMYAHG